MSGSVLCNDPLIISEQAYSCAVSNSMPKHGFAELPLLSIRSIHSSNPEENSYQLHQYPDRSVFFSTDDSPSFICQKGLKQTGAGYLIELQTIDEKRVDLPEPLPTMSSKVDKQDTGKPEESGGFPGLLNIKTFHHLVDNPTPNRPIIGAITASMESQSILPTTRQEAAQTPKTPSLVGLDLSLDLSLQHLLMLLLLGGPDMAEAFSLSRSQLMNASPLELMALVEKLEEYLLPGQVLTDHQNTTEDMHFTRLIQTLMQRLQSIQTLASRLSGGENTSPQLQRIRRDRLAVLQADFAGQIAVVQHSIQAGNDPALLLLDSIQALHEAEHNSDNFLPTETYLHDSVEILTLDVLTQKQDHVLEQIKRHDNAQPGDLWKILANRLMALEVETAQILAEIIAKTIPPVRTTPHGRKRASPPSDHPQEDSGSEQAGDNGNSGSPKKKRALDEAFRGGEQPPEQEKNKEKPLPYDGTRDFNLGLLSAVTNDDLNTAHWCLEQGADINATNGWRRTALTIAASKNNAVIIKMLLSREPMIDHTDNSGSTALMMAARYGHTHTVEILLEHGAAINHRDTYGDTSLIEAARYGHTHTVEILLERGAATNHHGAGGDTALILAAQKGHTEIVNILLKHGVAINDHDINGDTSLIEAARYGHTHTVEILLEHGAAINWADNFGMTALMRAVRRGRTSVVKALLERGADTRYVCAQGADINATDSLGRTALILAASEHNVAIVEMLLSREPMIDHTDDSGSTALIEAARYADTHTVEILLEHGAAIDHHGTGGNTALILAAQKGHTEVVNSLLEHGAAINHHGTGGNTALILAARNGHTEVVNSLLEHGAAINHHGTGGGTSLIGAARYGHTHTVEILLEHGAAINHHGTGSDTALIEAARYGHTHTVEILLEHGAAINHHGTDGDTSLILAAKGGYTEMVNSLLERGAAINWADNFGMTALMRAVRKGCTSVVKALLERGADTRYVCAQGADINATDSLGRTALILAASEHNVAIVEMLLSREPMIDHTDNSGSTALMRAAANGHLRIVNILLEHRAAINHNGTGGKTALILAAQNGYAYIVNILLEHGAAINYHGTGGNTALILAAKKGYTKIVKSLLEHGTSIEDRVSRNHIVRALTQAVINGHTETVKFLLESGVDTEYTDRGGYLDDLPPLYWAAYSGHTEVFKVFLEHNAKTDLLINNESLMSRIVEHDDITIAFILYGKVLESSPAHYCRLLHETIVRGIKNTDSGRYELFMAVFNTEALTRTGQYASFPLHLRAIAESPERYLELMQFGIERDKAEDAAEEGYIFECRQKLDRWRDQAMESMDDFFLDSAWMLDFLTLHDGKCIREWLLKYEPKLETARWKGLSLLHLVVLQNRPDVLAPLLFILKDLSPMSLRGLTPLHCARMLGYEAIRGALEPAVLQSEGRLTHCRWYRCLYCPSPSPVFSLQSLASNVVRRSGESLSSMHGRLKGAPGLTRTVFFQSPPEDSSDEED